MWGKLDGDMVWESNDVELLGVTIDDNLRFDKHVSNIYLKANRELSALSRVATQQTFVLMKTSFVFVFRRRLEDVLIKTNIFALPLRLQDVFMTFSRRLQDFLPRRLQDVFKASSERS